MSTNVDDTDLRILKILQQDARCTISQISKQINLTAPAITRRIQRMEDAGIIRGYTTLINTEKIGFRVHGYIIANVRSVALPQFYEKLDAINAITRCETIISGGKEVLFEFYFLDFEQLMDFYKGSICRMIEPMTAYLVKEPPGKETIIPFNYLFN